MVTETNDVAERSIAIVKGVFRNERNRRSSSGRSRQLGATGAGPLVKRWTKGSLGSH